MTTLSEIEVPPRLGRGRFELHESIGKGGLACVFRATDHESGTPCAVKVYLGPREDRARNAARFVSEAGIMKRIQHPRIVRVRDAGLEEGLLWSAMDWLPGGSLQDRIESEGAQPADRCVTWACQLLDALQEVHRNHLVHRDVKPANLLLDEHGDACLSDFGIARHPGRHPRYATGEDTLLGSRGYAAPEQLDDPRSVGPASDIYGAGATLFSLCTGRSPERLYLASLDPDILDTVPGALVPVVRTAVSLAVEDRYATAEEMHQALSQAWTTAGPGGEVRA